MYASAVANNDVDNAEDARSLTLQPSQLHSRRREHKPAVASMFKSTQKMYLLIAIPCLCVPANLANQHLAFGQS